MRTDRTTIPSFVGFHTTVIESVLAAGRTYWMSRQLKSQYGPHFRPRTYTFLGALYVPNPFESLMMFPELGLPHASVDSGMVLTLLLMIDLKLPVVSGSNCFVLRFDVD